MKKSIVLLATICLAFSLSAQTTEQIEKTVRSVADNILGESSFKILNKETGELFDVAGKSSGDPAILIIESPYNEWKYWNGVLNIAFDELGETLGDEKFKTFSSRNIKFAFDNLEYFEQHYNGEDRWGYPFGLMIGHHQLDDCGAEGASLIQVYQKDNRKEYRDYIDKTADHILNKQDNLQDGILCRAFPETMTIWGDDLYMSIPFMARMGALTGEQKYFDFSVKQVKLFNEYLYNPNNYLYFHCYYDNIGEHGVAFWSRCNGWVIMAQVELLKFLPEDHPGRQTVIDLLDRQIRGLARYQSASGMWHQLLDKTDSYLESSATAMFIYAISKGINEGWVDDRYAPIAIKGWKGLTQMITPDGQVKNICAGLNIYNDLAGYYNHPAPVNDIHGLGVVLMAGSEVIKLVGKEE